MNDVARTPHQLGTLIRRARLKKGLNQTELGDLVGLRQETISLIESGNPATRIENILALLGALEKELLVGPRSQWNWNETIERII